MVVLGQSFVVYGRMYLFNINIKNIVQIYIRYKYKVH